MVERAEWDGAGGAELWRRSVRRLMWAAVAANGLGGLVVFLLIAFLIPFGTVAPDWQIVMNAVAATLYIATAIALGARWDLRVTAPVERWLRRGGRPTPDERRLVLDEPSRVLRISVGFWSIGAVVFTLINVPESGWFALVIGGATLLGGETTCAVAYLLTERIMLPLTALALAGDVPSEPSGPGAAGRLMMAWSLGTGVPLLGILIIAVGSLAARHENATLLPAAVAFLAAIGVAVGLLAISVASRSIARPITAVRRGMASIQEGELHVTVPVDDGSEVGLLQAGFNQMAAGLRERERLRDLFGRHVGHDVARAALEHEGDVRLGGEVREIAVLFVDVVGSTGLAARRPPTEVVSLLNAFFGLVVEVVEAEGGWVNKFEGDAALCVFGAPTDRPDPAGDALRAARLLRQRLADELADVDAGIGVSAGPAVAGNIGAQERFEYTVIGDPVNEAARLCELAKRRPGRVLAAEAILHRAGSAETRLWEVGESALLRGRDAPTGLATPRVAPLPSAGAPLVVGSPPATPARSE